MPILLVLADPHPIVLDGLECVFHSEPDCRVLARCANGEATLAAVTHHRPDVLILDTHLPPITGLGVMRELRTHGLSTKVVLLAEAFEEEDQVLDALRLGVQGMFLKGLASRLLVQCVRKVHGGEQWLETHTSARALETLLRRESLARDHKGDLTARELAVVRMAVGGLPAREMAQRLSISEGTVKIHLHNVYKKVKVQNRVGLVLYAQSKKLV